MILTATRGAMDISTHRRSEQMANRSRSTFQKHYKEQARQQKQKDKAARRLEAKKRRANAEPGSGDTSPDLAGIPPDLQPLPATGDGDSGHESPRSR
jgi:hypothetical protein